MSQTGSEFGIRVGAAGGRIPLFQMQQTRSISLLSLLKDFSLNTSHFKVLCANPLKGFLIYLEIIAQLTSLKS